MENNFKTRSGYYINTYTEDGSKDVTVCLAECCDESEIMRIIDPVEEAIRDYINNKISQNQMRNRLRNYTSWGCEVIIREVIDGYHHSTFIHI